MSDINVVDKDAINNWVSQKSYIEKLMDNSALTAAHPDNTLVLAGPPRLIVDDNSFLSRILPIGMLQQFSLTQRLPTTPMQAIGSGRLFYVSGKAQVGATIMRLYVNGRNLLRVLSNNAIEAGVNVAALNDAAALDAADKCIINLDSELFKIPFGMGIIFKDKLHNTIGSFYMELCMISDWSLQVATGQTMILENVTLMADRIRPYMFSNIGNVLPNYPKSNIYASIFGNAVGPTQQQQDEQQQLK